MKKEREFTRTSEVTLSESDSDDEKQTIHGVAIGEGDVTLGKSKTKKKWTKEALQEATESLEGKPIVVDHNNNSHNVVGRVTKVKYKEGHGILYEGEIIDEELARKIDNDLLEVSLRGGHESVEEMEQDEESGAVMPSNIVFQNLSIVPSGAAPSNTVDTGEHEELSVAELRQVFEEAEDNEPSFSEGDKVSWADGQVYGIVREVKEDSVVVQVHTEDDDSDEASGQEIEVEDFEQLNKTDSFSQAEGLPEVQEDISTLSHPSWEEGQLVKWQVKPDLFGKIVHNDKDKKIVMVEIHKMEGDELQSTGFTITAGYSDLLPMENTSQSEEEMVNVSEGDLVEWPSSGERNAYGKVQDTISEGQYDSEIDGDQTVNAPAALIEVHKPMEDGWEASGEMVAHKIDTDTLKKVDSLPKPENLSSYELQDYTIHEPSYSGTTEGEWSRPDLEDFTDEMWDDLSQEEKSTIGDHFIMSESGFPSDNYGDMNLPVVEPNGDLSLSALRTVKGGHGVQAVEGASSDDEERVMKMVNNLANEEFDKDWSMEEEMSENGDMEVPDKHKFEDKEDAMEKAKELGLDGVHEMDGMYVPGSTHEDYMSAMEEMEELEDIAPSEHSVQEPNYSGTTERNWDAPMLKDLADTSDWGNMTEKEKEEVSGHFLVTAGDFPPERFRWLKLPVVEPNGQLNLNAIRAAKGGHGVHAVDGLSEDQKEEIIDTINRLASEEFGRNWTGSQSSLGDEAPNAQVEDGADTKDTVEVFNNNLSYRTMTEDIDTEGMDNPVVIEEEELSGLREENEELSERVDTLSDLKEDVEELSEKQDIIDEVDEEALGELRETDDPIVLSKGRFEELEEQVEQVKESYASELSAEYDAFDSEELKRKYDVTELAEKVDAIDDTVSEEVEEDTEELADPKSQDRTEEVEETEELSEDDTQEQIDDKLAELGWEEYASE